MLQMGGFRLCATARENFYWGGSIAIGVREQRPKTVEDQGYLHAYVTDIQQKYDLAETLDFKKMMGIHQSLYRNLITPEEFYCWEISDGPGAVQSLDYGQAEIDSDNLVFQGVLKLDVLKLLLLEKLVEFPTISDNEIDDKSKGDALSKVIALVQLTWFVAQIIARASRGLAISELELTTAALAGMNSAMYFFWWGKPRDVRFPLEIRTKGVEKLLAERMVDDVEWEFADGEFDFRKHLCVSIQEIFGTFRSFIASFPFGDKLSQLSNGIRAVPWRMRKFLFSIAKILKSRCRSTALVSPAGPVTVTEYKDPGTSSSVKDPDVQEDRHESFWSKVRTGLPLYIRKLRALKLHLFSRGTLQTD